MEKLLKVQFFQPLACLFVLLFTIGCAGDGGLISTGYKVKSDGVYWETPAGNSAFPTKKQKSVLTNADPGTFEALSYQTWGRDNDAVYYMGSALENSQPKSFRAFGPHLGADANSVWRRGKLIPFANGVSFVPLEGKYAKDKNTVFWANRTVEVCDLSSFQFLGGDIDEFAADAECAFYNGRQIPIKDRPSFQFYSGGFSQDEKAVYWHDRLLEGADPASFHVPKGMSYGKDSSGCWIGPQFEQC